MMLIPGRGISAARNTMRRGDQRSAISGRYIPLAECATQTTSAGFIPELSRAFTMISAGQALVSSAHLKSECENALTTTLQFIDQQPPAIGSLPASVNQTVCGHGLICR